MAIINIDPKYSRTEAGVIPEGWKIRSLDELGLWKGGATPSMTNTDFWINGTIYWASSGDIKTKMLSKTANMITEIAVKQSSTTLIQEGAILIVMRSGILRRYLPVTKNVIPTAINQDIKALIPNNHVSPDYLLQILSERGPDILSTCMKLGTTVESIEYIWLKKYQIPLPSLPEQYAIAAALTDVDALITSLDKLIAKKHDIKQATMQQLLTGKTRLPGFSGKWSSRLLSEVSWFQEGPGVRNTQFTRSGIKLLNGTNIYKGEVNLESTDRFISEKEAFGPYSHFLANPGDIVIACSGITIDKFHEKVAFVKEEHLPLCMNTSTMRFKSFNNHLLAKFLYHLLMSDIFKKQIGLQATGSAQLNFGPSHVANIVFMLPELKEQQAIANVLSDMDAEIVALEQKRDKTRALKQGMMQELLTGKTRLI